MIINNRYLLEKNILDIKNSYFVSFYHKFKISRRNIPYGNLCKFKISKDDVKMRKGIKFKITSYNIFQINRLSRIIDIGLYRGFKDSFNNEILKSFRQKGVKKKN